MRLAHTMLRTGSPEEMVNFYKNAFNMEMKRKKEMDTFTLYFLGHPGQQAEIELTYNHGEDDKYGKGEGFGHIAIQTPKNISLSEAYKQAVQAGGEDYRPPEECPGNYAFVKDPEGYEVEILARSS
ncbi:MAG: lactoylglutathione lyase family protein [Candidatus Nanosalina sp. J07AB43]|jgi:Lactoylglutathione lyase and related lyases|nr:MAG: lactoylglutathione lyase family protein [Candidatus Nanosalina sp. J07AB43]